MNVFQRQAAQNNGGPVQQAQGAVIDLTSDDEDEDVDLFADALEHPVKKERLEANKQAPVQIPRMRDALPEFGLAEPNRNPLAPLPNAFGNPRDIWGDYMLDDEFDDEVEAGAFRFDQEFAFHTPPIQQPQPAEQAPSLPADLPVQENVAAEIMESRVECVDAIINIFPGICRDYVSELYDTVAKSSERLIAHILDKMDKGSSYPNAKEKQKKLKRKREVDEDQEAARKYGAPDRVIPSNIGGIRSYIAKILSVEFPLTQMAFINTTLSQTGYRLFSAYEVLEEVERTYDKHNNAPYPRLKNPRKNEDFTDAKVAAFLASPATKGVIDHEKVEVFKELQAARRIRAKADARREVERAAEIEEEANVARAEAEGTMSECGCCCCDYPLNRMVHCEGDTMHWFCKCCAKRNAEVEIGKSKYELHCMSTDKCTAGFSTEQKAQFLDDNTRVALERNEQEANLRLAGIENLASCPFCPFAAEYPPIEVDREFRCQAPDCERVSCRLCKLESHIPKSCEENAKENGLSIRRQIEEAMSAAMIRKCNKCATPFVKEEGCNKMTCTRNGCRNIQCYVCSKSCDYNHFNDPSRGGKPGNCPLFESVEQRHNEEVSKAEKEALEKVLADHPEYSAEDLKVKMSENVKKDDERRKAMDPRARLDAIRAAAIGRHGLRAAMDLMELRPMMPRPPAMIRKAHDIPALGEQARVPQGPQGDDFPDVIPYPDPLDPLQDGYYPAFLYGNDEDDALGLPRFYGAPRVRRHVYPAPPAVVGPGDAVGDAVLPPLGRYQPAYAPYAPFLYQAPDFPAPLPDAHPQNRNAIDHMDEIYDLDHDEMFFPQAQGIANGQLAQPVQPAGGQPNGFADFLRDRYAHHMVDEAPADKEPSPNAPQDQVRFGQAIEGRVRVRPYEHFPAAPKQGAAEIQKNARRRLDLRLGLRREDEQDRAERRQQLEEQEQLERHLRDIQGHRTRLKTRINARRAGPPDNIWPVIPAPQDWQHDPPAANAPAEPAKEAKPPADLEQTADQERLQRFRELQFARRRRPAIDYNAAPEDRIPRFFPHLRAKPDGNNAQAVPVEEEKQDVDRDVGAFLRRLRQQPIPPIHDPLQFLNPAPNAAPGAGSSANPPPQAVNNFNHRIGAMARRLSRRQQPAKVEDAPAPAAVAAAPILEFPVRDRIAARYAAIAVPIPNPAPIQDEARAQIQQFIAQQEDRPRLRGFGAFGVDRYPGHRHMYGPDGNGNANAIANRGGLGGDAANDPILTAEKAMGRAGRLRAHMRELQAEMGLEVELGLGLEELGGGLRGEIKGMEEAEVEEEYESQTESETETETESESESEREGGNIVGIVERGGKAKA